MEKEFITYEQSLALKELGFDESCFGYYDNGVFIFWYDSEQESELLLNCSAPLKQQVFRWFREKRKIEATVACYYSKILGISYEERQYHCHIVRDGVTTKGPKFKTYEESELACIDKLIELVKNKKDEK